MADVSPLSDVVEIMKVVSPPAAVALLGWWLKGQFIAVANIAALALKSHEELDNQRFERIEEKSQVRHEENLDRFGSINEQLAKLTGTGLMRRH